MTGILPRLFGKSQSQYPSETRRMMTNLHDYKTTQHSEKLENELKLANSMIDELQGNLEALKIGLEKKDVAIEGLKRDRETISQDLRKQELSNKLMKQQLDKEKRILENETQRFIIERSNLKTKRQLMLGQIVVPPEDIPSTMEGCTKKIATLQGYNQYLQATLLEREKTISNLCEKFLALRQRGTHSVSQLNHLRGEFEEISKDLLIKLTDARNEINIIAEAKFQDPMDKKNAALIQVVQKNGHLILENSTLRLKVSELKQSVTSLQLESSLDNINTKKHLTTSLPTGRLAVRQVSNCTTYSESTEKTNRQGKTPSPDVTIQRRKLLPSQSSSLTVRSAPSTNLSETSRKQDRHSIEGSLRSESRVASQKLDCRSIEGSLRSESRVASQKLDCRSIEGSLRSSESRITSKIQQQQHPPERQNRRVRRNRTRRERQRHKSSTDSSGRESPTISVPYDVANIPRQLLSELHPCVTASQSRESNQTGYKTPSHHNLKKDESLDSLYSKYYIEAVRTQSTPGKIETGTFTERMGTTNTRGNVIVKDRSPYRKS